VLDGRAPYSEPEVLKRANGLLGQSIRYFADPSTQPLPRTGEPIDYLLVATEPQVFATSLNFPTSSEGLARAQNLELVYSGPGFRVYKVNGTAPAG
jgi:hypothetical protein